MVWNVFSQTYLNYLSSILKIVAYQTSFWEDLEKSVLSVHINLMSKKKLGSFNDLINAYFQYFIYLPRYEKFLASIFCKSFVDIAEQNPVNFGTSWGKHYKAMKTFDHWQIEVVLWHWYSFKFKRLVVLNVHDVKNQFIMTKRVLFWEDV